MKFLAYDEYEVTPSDHRRIAEHDGFYRTTTGDPVNYWFLDNERNQFILYPRPSSITWDDSGLPHEPTDSYSDTGGLNTWSEAAIDDADLGVITLTLDTANNVFAVFEAIPQEVDTVSDTIDFPEFLVKYIRFGALERCFGADTDGFIPSLRDYWNFRKELGVRGIRRFKSMRRQDRDYQLSGGRGTVRSRHPRLPAEYPSM